MTYTRGINEDSACKLLSELTTFSMTFLAEHFDELMCVPMSSTGGIPAEGFTIGRGKALYWYITPMPRSGTYRCIRTFENGEIGSPRSIDPDKLITIHYK
jgi:hypothetical protein